MTRSHLIASTIVKLMYELSKLIIIMGRYLGVYAKDSLDELLLTTHHKSSYRGKSREIERKAFSEWIDVNIEITDETKVAKILGHMNDNNEWITTSGIVDPSDAKGDNYPDVILNGNWKPVHR